MTLCILFSAGWAITMVCLAILLIGGKDTRTDLDPRGRQRLEAGLGADARQRLELAVAAQPVHFVGHAQLRRRVAQQLVEGLTLNVAAAERLAEGRHHPFPARRLRARDL